MFKSVLNGKNSSYWHPVSYCKQAAMDDNPNISSSVEKIRQLIVAHKPKI